MTKPLILTPPRVYRDPKGKITCVALYACNPQGIYFGELLPYSLDRG